MSTLTFLSKPATAANWAILHDESRGSAAVVNNGRAVIAFTGKPIEPPAENVIAPEIGQAIDTFLQSETAAQFVNLTEMLVSIESDLADAQTQIAANEQTLLNAARAGRIDADSEAQLRGLTVERDALQLRQELLAEALRGQWQACRPALAAVRQGAVAAISESGTAERAELLIELARVASPILNQLLAIRRREQIGDDPALAGRVLGDDPATMTPSDRRELLASLKEMIGE